MNLDEIVGQRRKKAEQISALSPPPAGLAAIMVTPLVCCADCRDVRYSSWPGGEKNPLAERLDCRHGHTIDLKDAEEARHYCTKFKSRRVMR